MSWHWAQPKSYSKHRFLVRSMSWFSPAERKIRARMPVLEDFVIWQNRVLWVVSHLFLLLEGGHSGSTQLFSTHFKASLRFSLSGSPAGRASCNRTKMAVPCYVLPNYKNKPNPSEISEYHNVIFMLGVRRCLVLRRNKPRRRGFFGSSRLLHICLRYFSFDLRRGN